jgi:hypothetical protein
MQLLVLGTAIGSTDRRSHILEGVLDRWHVFAVEPT